MTNSSPSHPVSPLVDSALRRYPVRKGELLQAWDSADELLLEHLRTLELAGRKVLILGDAFGALSVGLRKLAADFERPPTVTTYTDSFLAAEGIRMNSENRIQPIDRLTELRGPYEIVVLRIPKNLSFLEDMLARLSRHVAPGAKLVAGYRVKHQANGAFDLLAKYFGATTTSLAQKKARLIFATYERAPAVSPFPLSVPMPGFEKPFVNHSNVFSRERLDIGTRFFLEHIPGRVTGTILDLGCGNGVIGIAAKRKNPGAKILFTDESRMAIESATENFRANFPENSGDADFHWTNSFAGGAPDTVDYILCNPPFHQGTTIGDFVAREMFRDALRVLRPGGTLRVIGNTHLRYPFALRNLFGNSNVVATNAKFQIVDAIKSR